MREIHQREMEGCSINTRSVFFRSVKVVKDKESLRNCYRTEETKETRRLVWDPGTEEE